jgi:hypothetical protein
MDTRRFHRTVKGQDEISQGRKALKGKLRTVLFLVDAAKSADEIQRQIQLIGAPGDALAQLHAGGYIVEAGGRGASAPATVAPTENTIASFRVAQAFMNEAVVDALGIRAFGFTLRLERCATREDLAKLLPDFTQSLLKKLDREAVRALVVRAHELLGVAPA